MQRKIVILFYAFNLELDLYSDYLVVNQRQASATRLAALLEGEFSHDAFTRKLTQLY